MNRSALNTTGLKRSEVLVGFPSFATPHAPQFSVPTARLLQEHAGRGGGNAHGRDPSLRDESHALCSAVPESAADALREAMAERLAGLETRTKRSEERIAGLESAMVEHRKATEEALHGLRVDADTAIGDFKTDIISMAADLKETVGTKSSAQEKVLTGEIAAVGGGGGKCRKIGGRAAKLDSVTAHCLVVAALILFMFGGHIQKRVNGPSSANRRPSAEAAFLAILPT